MAELDDDYIEPMENVLEVYERPLSAEEPVVCVPEGLSSPGTLRTAGSARTPCRD
ncbi:MAG: hypothetical protein ACLQU1_40480 [Bryobacteraceae bacterium]